MEMEQEIRLNLEMLPVAVENLCHKMLMMLDILNMLYNELKITLKFLSLILLLLD